MTRTSHRPHPTTGFPVYCLEWADDEVVIMGGGGGASRSGIENKLVSCALYRSGPKADDMSETRKGFEGCEECEIYQ